MKKFMRATYANCSPHNNPRGSFYIDSIFYFWRFCFLRFCFLRFCFLRFCFLRFCSFETNGVYGIHDDGRGAPG